MKIDSRALQSIAGGNPFTSKFRGTGASTIAQVSNQSVDSIAIKGSEPMPDNGRLGALTAGLAQNYGTKNIGERAQEKTAKDLRSFEERLDPAAREAFQKLPRDKQVETVRLGKVFAGNNLGDSSLVKLMQDGRLYEKDSSGMTPLQRLTEATQPDRPDFQTKGNFVTRVLDAIENPTNSSDAKRKGTADPSVNPAEYIREAGENYNDALTLGKPTDWDRSVSEG